MKSARETGGLLCHGEFCSVCNRCVAIAEAIQAAREDGARWMLKQIRGQAAVKTTQMVTVEEIDVGYFDPHHVRGVAP